MHLEDLQRSLPAHRHIQALMRFPFPDGDATPVADFPFRTRQRIDEGSFSAIRVSCICDTHNEPFSRKQCDTQKYGHPQ